MNSRKKIILAIICIAAVVIGILCAVILPKKDPSANGGTTIASQADATAPVVTQNKRENMKFKKTNTLTVKDTADGDIISLPVNSLRAAQTANGGVLFYSEDGLEAILAAVESLAQEDASYKAYLYGRHMRIEKTMADGSINTYSIVQTTDDEGNTVYDFSDCRAYFTGDGGAYAAFKFPYYYLDASENLAGLDYGKFGDTFVITVSKSEFMSFYENSAMYIIKDGTANDFSLEHTFAAVDNGNGYPVKFSFGTDAAGRNTVTITMGSAEQITETLAQTDEINE